MMAQVEPITLPAAEWAAELDALHRRIAGRFYRAEPRWHARAYLLGLLSDTERKTGWALAERAGQRTPDRMQRLLATSRWDVDGVRDDLRDYVTDHLGTPDGTGVLVVDETGFLRKGTTAAGVQRQYSGTAGKIDNCQIGVFLAYASPHGHALVDRELYLPKAWTEDPDRRRAAGVPAEVEFATKPQLAVRMLTRALDAGLPVGWVTGDEVYGCGKVRLALEQRQVGYVLAVERTEPVWALTDRGPAQLPACELLGGVGEADWQLRSAGDGAKGPRVYRWARVGLWRLGAAQVRHWLLVRRNTRTGELAFYVCYHPDPATSLADLVRVAGGRWRIEECFQQAKGEVGLDHYQVRSWSGWYRHITLSMLALALLAVVRARTAAKEAGEKGASA